VSYRLALTAFAFGGVAVLNILNQQIRECLDHAEDCARKAKTACSAELRDDYLMLERRWLFLARSYELTEQVASQLA
jgi:hypothetical protein